MTILNSSLVSTFNFLSVACILRTIQQNLTKLVWPFFRRAVGHGAVKQSSSVFVFPTVSNFMISDCRESFADSMEPNLASHRCLEVQRIDVFRVEKWATMDQNLGHCTMTRPLRARMMQESIVWFYFGYSSQLSSAFLSHAAPHDTASSLPPWHSTRGLTNSLLCTASWLTTTHIFLSATQFPFMNPPKIIFISNSLSFGTIRRNRLFRPFSIWSVLPGDKTMSAGPKSVHYEPVTFSHSDDNFR